VFRQSLDSSRLARRFFGRRNHLRRLLSFVRI
jgi:hypothetical protein